jgi:hypothetical protein
LVTVGLIETSASLFLYFYIFVRLN